MVQAFLVGGFDIAPSFPLSSITEQMDQVSNRSGVASDDITDETASLVDLRWGSDEEVKSLNTGRRKSHRCSRKSGSVTPPCGSVVQYLHGAKLSSIIQEASCCSNSPNMEVGSCGDFFNVQHDGKGRTWSKMVPHTRIWRIGSSRLILLSEFSRRTFWDRNLVSFKQV